MLDRFLRPPRNVTPAPSTPTPPPADSGEPVDWNQYRAPPQDGDRVLLSETHVWLRRIPTPLHPKHLCRYFPHVANRLAQAWDHPDVVDRIFDDLMVDRRGRRKGFSDRVQMEIRRLQQFHDRRPRFERLRPLGLRLRAWATGPAGPRA